MKKIKQPPRPKTLPVLLLLLGLLCVVFLILMFRNKAGAPSITNPQNNADTTNTQKRSLPKTKLVTGTTQPPQTEPNKAQNPTDTPPISQTRNTPETEIPYLWKCFGERVRCAIATNDRLYDLLGQEENTIRMFVDGVWIEPKTVSFQLNQKTYSDEVISDAVGRTLLSASKEYNPKTRDLVLWIGMNASYYNSVSPKQRQTLYLEELVRILKTLFGESSSDFVTLQGVVQSLSSWQPKLK